MLPDDERPVRRLLHDESRLAGPTGVVIERKDMAVEKAKEDGLVRDERGLAARVRKGDPIPEGMTFETRKEREDFHTSRARVMASKLGDRGPSAVTSGAGPSATLSETADTPNTPEADGKIDNPETTAPDFEDSLIHVPDDNDVPVATGDDVAQEAADALTEPAQPKAEDGKPASPKRNK